MSPLGKRSGRIRYQGRDRLPCEVGANGLTDPLKRRAVVQGTSTHHRPEALANPLSVRAACALGDMAVNDHKPQGLFDFIVGRIDGGSGDELEVGLPVFVEALGHVDDEPVERSEESPEPHCRTRGSCL